MSVVKLLAMNGVELLGPGYRSFHRNNKSNWSTIDIASGAGCWCVGQSTSVTPVTALRCYRPRDNKCETRCRIVYGRCRGRTALGNRVPFVKQLSASFSQYGD